MPNVSVVSFRFRVDKGNANGKGEFRVTTWSRKKGKLEHRNWTNLFREEPELKAAMVSAWRSVPKAVRDDVKHWPLIRYRRSSAGDISSIEVIRRAASKLSAKDGKRLPNG